MNSDFDDETEELKWMTKFGQETGRPVWFLLTDRPTDKVRWRRLMDWGAQGARGRGDGDRSGRRPAGGGDAGYRYGTEPILHPAQLSGVADSFRSAERMKRMQDPAFRAQVLSEAPSRSC